VGDAIVAAEIDEAAQMEAFDELRDCVDSPCLLSDLPTLWLPPGWEKIEPSSWATDAPHLPSWVEDGTRPEEDKEELLLRADMYYHFALSLKGGTHEEREQRKDLLQKAQRSFFFAQNLEERAAPEPAEPAYAISGMAPTGDETLESAPEPEQTETAAREKIRSMAASAVSYEEQWGTEANAARKKPAKREDSLAGNNGASMTRHWWEKSVGTAPRQPPAGHSPTFGSLNL
jgi:hypothetical protein